MSSGIKVTVREPNAFDMKIDRKTSLSVVKSSGKGKKKKEVPEKKPLKQADVKKIVARLPAIEVKKDDVKEYFKREASLKPPLNSAKIVEMKFPPDGPPLELPKDLETVPPREVKILRVSPTGRINQDRPLICVHFSTPMIELSSVDEVEKMKMPELVVEPPLTGKMKWKGTQDLEWVCDTVPIPRSRVFTFTVKKGAKSAEGGVLKNDYSWKIETPRVHLVSSYSLGKYSLNPANPLMYFSFSQKIDPANVLSKMTLKEGIKKIKLKLVSDREVSLMLAKKPQCLLPSHQYFVTYHKNYVEKGDQKSFFVTPQSTLKLSGRYRLYIGGGIKSLEGPLLSEKTYDYDLYILDKNFKCVEKEKRVVYPNYTSNQSFSFSFNNPIDVTLFKPSMVKMTPELPSDAKITANGKYITVSFRVLREYGKELKFTFNKGLTDVLGQKLGKDFICNLTLNISANVQYPQFQSPFNNRIVIFDPTLSNEPMYEVKVKNLKEFEIAVFQITPEDFHSCPRGDYPVQVSYYDKVSLDEIARVGKKVVEKKIKVKSVVNETKIVEVPIVQYLQFPKEKLGNIVVVCRPTKDAHDPIKHRHYRGCNYVQRSVFQFTKHSVEAISTPYHKTFIMVTSLTNGKIIKKPTLNYINYKYTKQIKREEIFGGYKYKRTIWYYYDIKKQKEKKYVGAKDGLIEIKKNELVNGLSVYVYKKGNDVAFTTNIYQQGSKGSHWSRFVFNDRGMYKPNEEAHVKGYVRQLTYKEGGKRELVFPKAGLEIEWICTDPRRVKYAEGKTKFNKYGGFHFTFKIPDNVNLGNTAVRIKSKHRRCIDQTHYLQVQEFRPPEFVSSCSVVNRRNFIVGLNNPVLSATASYYTGGPLSESDCTWTVSYSNTSFTPSGRYKYTFQNSYHPIFEGQPVNTSTTARVGRRNYDWDDEWEDDDWSDDEYIPRKIGGGFRGGESVSMKGKLNDKGEHKIAVVTKIKDKVQNLKPVNVNAKSVIMDINRQALNSNTAFTVHPSSVYIGLNLRKTFLEEKESLPLNVLVTNIDGEILEGVDYTIDIYMYEKLIKTLKLKSESKESSLDIKLNEEGYFYIVGTVVDSHGLKNSSSVSIWSVGKEGAVDLPSGAYLQQQNISLIANKTSFKVGEKVNVFVKAPFEGDGIFFFLCNGVLQRHLFTLRGKVKSKVFSIVVKKEYMPNFYASAYMFGVQNRIDPQTNRPSDKLPPEPTLGSGRIHINVPTVDYKIKVDIKPKHEMVKPGMKSEITVSTGRPKSVVTMWIVDEAILALSGFRASNPLSTFWPSNSEGCGTVFRNRLSVFLKKMDEKAKKKEEEKRKQKKMDDDDDDCSESDDEDAGDYDMDEDEECEDDEMDMEKEMKMEAPSRSKKKMSAFGGKLKQKAKPKPKIQVRKSFKPLVVFSDSQVTNKKGDVTIPVKFPDNLTKFKIWAIATHSTASFGFGEKSIISKLPFSIRPSLPRFLNFGDVCELSCVVANQADVTINVHMAIRLTNLELVSKDKDGFNLKIPKGMRMEVRFPVKTVKSGIARVQIGATIVGNKALEHSDAVEEKLRVFTPVSLEDFATYGELDGNVCHLQNIKAPREVFPNVGGITVLTSSTALQSLTDAFLYLYNYQFDCVEQASSRILGITGMQDILEAFNVPQMPSKAKLQEVVQTGIKKIKKAQLVGGGWGFWSTESKINYYLSIYAPMALIRAKENGYKVDLGVLNDCKKFLLNVYSRVTHYWWGTSANLIAMSLYVLSLFAENKMLSDSEKKTVLNKARAHINAKYLGFEGKCWLAMAIFKCSKTPGKEKFLKTVVKDINSNSHETAETATFATNYGNDSMVTMLYSSRRTDAIILETLCYIDPKNYLIAKIVKGLMKSRRNGRWRNTQENCYILFALKKYFKIFEKHVPDFNIKIWLTNEYMGSVKFKGRETDYKKLSVPMKVFRGDMSKVEKDKPVMSKKLYVLKEGKGRCYYRIGMTYAPLKMRTKIVDMGFIVTREYFPVEDESHVVKQKDGSYIVKSGEMVRVRVTFTNTTRRYHVAMVDYLPAGFEALNTALATTIEAPREKSSSKYGRWWWRRNWYDHKNMRDERVEAFTSYLYPSKHSFEYNCRATQVGSFVVPPVKVEEMYSPEVFGKSKNDHVVVKEMEEPKVKVPPKGSKVEVKKVEEKVEEKKDVKKVEEKKDVKKVEEKKDVKKVEEKGKKKKKKKGLLSFSSLANDSDDLPMPVKKK